MPNLTTPEWVRASPDDIDFLFKLRIETMQSHLIDHGIRLTAEQHHERVEHEFGNCYLIVADGHRVGALKFLENDSSLEILQLQIKRGNQGKGYATAVLNQLIAKANAANRTIELSVLKQSPALRLYRRLGFQVNGEDAHEYNMILST